MKVDEKKDNGFFQVVIAVIHSDCLDLRSAYQFNFIYSMVCGSTFLKFRDS